MKDRSRPADTFFATSTEDLRAELKNPSDVPPLDVGRPIVLPGGLVHLLTSGKLNTTELSYLLITEEYTRMGNGRGCWLTCSQFATRFDVHVRSVKKIREKLLRKGMLIRTEDIVLATGERRPAFKTWWSDAFLPPVLANSSIGNRTRGGAPVGHRGGAPVGHPIYKEKTKEINTRDIVCDDSPDTSNTSDSTMPFINLPADKPDLSYTLANELYKLIKSAIREQPDAKRPKTPISPTFPKKTWPAKMAKLIRREGETAVKKMFDRLKTHWSAMLPDVPGIDLFCNQGYFGHILPKRLAAMDALAEPDTLSPELKGEWETIRHLPWPGNDKKAVRLCLKHTHAALAVLRAGLKRIAANAQRWRETPAGMKLVRGTAVEQAAATAYQEVRHMRAGDLMAKVLARVPTHKADVKLDYRGPKVCLLIDQLDAHLTVGPVLANACSPHTPGTLAVLCSRLTEIAHEDR